MLLDQLLLDGARVKANHGSAFLHHFAAARHPGDAQIRHHGRVDLRRSPGPQLAAAADDGEKFTFAGLRHRQFARRLRSAKFVDAHPAGGTERGHAGQPKQRANALAECVHFAGSSTTAAERSGVRRGSVLSSLKTAENVLTGLPSADDAMGLANSKCAGRARSGYASK